jgi:hypothetical protein
VGRNRSVLLVIQIALHIATEAAWLWALGAFLGELTGIGDGPLIGLPEIVVVLAVAALVARLALSRLRSFRLARALLVASILASPLVFLAVESWMSGGSIRHLLSGIGPWEGMTAPLVLLLWWRGTSVGSADSDAEAAEWRLRVAVFGLAAVLLASAAVPWRLPDLPVVLTGSALLALFSGLVGISLARALDAGPRHRGTRLGVSRQWTLMLLGIVCALLVVSLLVSNAFTFEVVLAVFRALLGVIEKLLLAVLYLISIPVGFIMELVTNLFQGLFNSGEQPEQRDRPLPDLNRQLEQQRQGGSPPEFLLILRWVLIGVLALLLLLVAIRLLARAIRSLRDRDWEEEEYEELRDFVWPGLSLRAGLRSLLDRRRRTPGTGPAIRERGPGEDAREMYRELLRIGTELERPRAPSETPSEYARSLTSVEPINNSRRDVDTLTRAYIQARYGPDPPTTGTLRKAREALDNLRRLLRQTREANQERPDGRTPSRGGR